MSDQEFTKLFASILDSSVWRQPDHIRIVWVTMMALADEAGYVGQAVPALADRARVTVEQCREALEVFLAPDPDSRSQAHGGRRIKAVPRGWVLLNHGVFRRSLAEDRERSRKRQWWQENRSAEARARAAAGEPKPFPKGNKSRTRRLVRLASLGDASHRLAGGSETPETIGENTNDNGSAANIRPIATTSEALDALDTSRSRERDKSPPPISPAQNDPDQPTPPPTPPEHPPRAAEAVPPRPEDGSGASGVATPGGVAPLAGAQSTFADRLEQLKPTISRAVIADHVGALLGRATGVRWGAEGHTSDLLWIAEQPEGELAAVLEALAGDPWVQSHRRAATPFYVRKFWPRFALGPEAAPARPRGPARAPTVDEYTDGDGDDFEALARASSRVGAT